MRVTDSEMYAERIPITCDGLHHTRISHGREIVHYYTVRLEAEYQQDGEPECTWCQYCYRSNIDMVDETLCNHNEGDLFGTCNCPTLSSEDPRIQESQIQDGMIHIPE